MGGTSLFYTPLTRSLSGVRRPGRVSKPPCPSLTPDPWLRTAAPPAGQGRGQLLGGVVGAGRRFPAGPGRPGPGGRGRSMGCGVIRGDSCMRSAGRRRAIGRPPAAGDGLEHRTGYSTGVESAPVPHQPIEARERIHGRPPSGGCLNVAPGPGLEREGAFATLKPGHRCPGRVRPSALLPSTARFSASTQSAEPANLTRLPTTRCAGRAGDAHRTDRMRHACRAGGSEKSEPESGYSASSRLGASGSVRGSRTVNVLPRPSSLLSDDFARRAARTFRGRSTAQAQCLRARASGCSARPGGTSRTPAPARPARSRPRCPRP